MAWTRRLALALLRLIVAVAAMLSVAALVGVAPLTRPTTLADAAVEAGAAEQLAPLIVDQLAVDGSPAGLESRMRTVAAEAFGPGFVSDSLRSVAGTAEMWISGDGRPPIEISLSAPLSVIAEHADGHLLVLPLMAEPEPGSPGAAAREAWLRAGGDPDGPDESDLDDPRLGDLPETRAALEAALGALPSELTWSGNEPWWQDLMATAADVRHGSARLGWLAAAVAALAAAIGIWVDPRPTRAAAPAWVATAALWAGLTGGGLWALAAAGGVLIPAGPARVVADVLVGLWPGWLAASLLGLAVAGWLASRAMTPHPGEHPVRVRTGNRSEERPPALVP